MHLILFSLEIRCVERYYQPPSMAYVAPLTNLDSSLSSHAIKLPHSSEVPRRLIAVG